MAALAGSAEHTKLPTRALAKTAIRNCMGVLSQMLADVTLRPPSNGQPDT